MVPIGPREQRLRRRRGQTRLGQTRQSGKAGARFLQGGPCCAHTPASRTLLASYLGVYEASRSRASRRPCQGKVGGGPLGIRRSHLAVGNLSKGPFLREMFRSCSCELSVKAEGAPKPQCSGAFRPLLQHRPEAGFGSGPVRVRDARGAGPARVSVAWIPLRSSSCGLRSSCRVAAVARTGGRSLFYEEPEEERVRALVGRPRLTKPASRPAPKPRIPAGPWPRPQPKPGERRAARPGPV